MADLFSEFLQEPNGANFSALRAWLIDQPEYEFASLDLHEVTALAADQNHAAVLDRAEDAMPDWILSPSMHQFIAEAARAEGEEDRAQAEEYLVKACLAGLLGSGDGSATKPYLITHPADEYDVLEALGKKWVRQKRLKSAPSLLDCFECVDGTPLHFDISPSIPQNAPTA